MSEWVIKCGFDVMRWLTLKILSFSRQLFGSLRTSEPIGVSSPGFVAVLLMKILVLVYRRIRILPASSILIFTPFKFRRKSIELVDCVTMIEWNHHQLPDQLVSSDHRFSDLSWGYRNRKGQFYTNKKNTISDQALNRHRYVSSASWMFTHLITSFHRIRPRTRWSWELALGRTLLPHDDSFRKWWLSPKFRRRFASIC